MRVFLYCIDALEYNFIDSSDFETLKQTQHHRLEIPEQCMTILDDGSLKPFTPVIWKAILTGESEKDSPSLKPERYENIVVNWFHRRKIARKMWRKALDWGLFRRGLPVRLGVKRKDILAGVDSILDTAEHPIVQQNPVLAEVKWSGIGAGIKPLEVVGKFEKIFQEEKTEALERLKEPWDLYIFYTKIIDVVGHLLWGRGNYTETYYRIIDDFAMCLKKILGDDVVFIVLSDHGIKGIEGISIGGEHSHHAYVSFNRQVEVPEPLSILHIRDIIERFLKEETPLN